LNINKHVNLGLALLNYPIDVERNTSSSRFKKTSFNVLRTRPEPRADW